MAYEKGLSNHGNNGQHFSAFFACDFNARRLFESLVLLVNIQLFLLGMLLGRFLIRCLCGT